MNWKILQEPYPFDGSLKKATYTALAFGFFVFFFLAFFQPFGINNWHSETKTVELFGYGLVTTFCLFSNAFVFTILCPKWYSEKTWTVGKNILFTCWVFFFIGFGNLVYSVYQGYLDFTLQGFLFYQGLTVAIGIFPVVFSTFLVYNRRFQSMSKAAEDLNESIHVNEKVEDKIELPSQNKSEQLVLNIDDLLAVKSIENYVEVIHLENETENRTILRNTLKNIEQVLLPVSSISKCHRSYLVNLKKVNHFSGNAQGLMLNFEHEGKLEVPVSRSYVKSIKSKLTDLS